MQARTHAPFTNAAYPHAPDPPPPQLPVHVLHPPHEARPVAHGAVEHALPQAGPQLCQRLRLHNTLRYIALRLLVHILIL